MLHDKTEGPAPASVRLVAGLVSGVIGAFACNPFELVKTRLRLCIRVLLKDVSLIELRCRGFGESYMTCFVDAHHECMHMSRYGNWRPARRRHTPHMHTRASQALFAAYMHKAELLVYLPVPVSTCFDQPSARLSTSRHTRACM